MMNSFVLNTIKTDFTENKQKRNNQEHTLCRVSFSFLKGRIKKNTMIGQTCTNSQSSFEIQNRKHMNKAGVNADIRDIVKNVIRWSFNIFFFKFLLCLMFRMSVHCVVMFRVSISRINENGFAIQNCKHCTDTNDT